MFNLKKKLTIAALLAASTLNVANAGVLDTFQYDSALVVDGAGDVDSDSFVPTGVYTPAGDVAYTLTVNSDSNPLPNGTAANYTLATFNSGTLSYDAGASVDATLELDYDATQGTWDVTDLGTATGFYVDVVDSTSGFNLNIDVADSTGASSVGNLVVAAATLGQRVYVGFNAFTGSADFSDLVSLDLTFISGNAGDFILTEIGTVPEPTSLAILGLGLLGFAASRKKQA